MADKDRISKLPDDILVGILAYLRYKYAVRAGALSRRWRHLHMQLPYVDVDILLNCRLTDSDMQNMERMLHRRLKDEKQIRHLSLACPVDSPVLMSFAQKFITLANAQKLDLFLACTQGLPYVNHGDWPLELPPATTKLTFHAFSRAFRAPRIHGDSLKLCHLHGSMILRQDSLHVSLSSLEDLRISDCTLASGIDITSRAMPRLKHLRISHVSVMHRNETAAVNILVDELETLRMACDRYSALEEDPSSPRCISECSSFRSSFTVYSSVRLRAPKLRVFVWRACYANEVRVDSVGRLSHVEIELFSGRLPMVWPGECNRVQDMEYCKKLMRSILAGLMPGLQPRTLDHVERDFMQCEDRKLVCQIVDA